MAITTAATLTTNIDVDYIVGDYNSTVDALITFANIQYGPGTSANRLWTDFNTDSFSRNWLEILAYVSDIFFFYFSTQATQSYLQTASLQSAINDIAAQFGFVPASAASSSGNATFTVTGALTIPRGFQVQSSNGEQFYVTLPVVTSIAGQYTANVLQGIIKTENFTAVGVQNESFTLIGPNVIVDSTNINPEDLSPQISVNGNPYTLVNTFIYSNGTDTAAIFDSLGNVIGGGGRVFLLGVDANSNPYVEFGDGIFGRQLRTGDTVTVEYRTGGGTAGNIGANTLTTMLTSQVGVTSVNNTSAFSGGSDPQTIQELQQLIPASLTTLERAVTLSDYGNILVENFPQVYTASAAASTQPGVDVNIYVVPQGNGITPITTNTILLSTLSNFIDVRKMVTTQFQILNAYGVQILITLKVFISATTSQKTTIQNIQTVLDNFFSLTTGGPAGTGVTFAQQVLITDIVNIIETIPGINEFEIKELTYIPNVISNIIGLNTTYVISEVSIFPNVEQVEWLVAAAGSVTEGGGVTLFSNPNAVGFTYTSGTGLISYSLPVDLSSVSPGDLFIDGAAAQFEIFGINTSAYTLYISTGETVNTTPGVNAGGSIKSGNTTQYETFKVFKKILGNVTNFSPNSITDTNLDLTYLNSTGTALTNTTLLDNTQIFVPNQYASTEYFLVDAANNIWDIVSNSSDTITTGSSAVNSGAITALTSGPYSIVKNLTNYNILFSNTILPIEYNNATTVFSIGGEFNQIGTIGDSFQISKVQHNVGVLGTAVDILEYTPSTGQVEFNGGPVLTGINNSYSLVDSSGQIFNIVGSDNRNFPSTIFDSTNMSSSYTLTGTGSGTEIAQGFQVPSTSSFPIVSFYLKMNGNINGYLTAEILNDSGGLPNSSSVVAVSNPVNINTISNSSYQNVVFTFTTPPTLNSGTTYHLTLTHDATYSDTYTNNQTVFSNSGLVAFSYNATSGVVTYASAVDLSAVISGNYFLDFNNNPFIILSVNAASNELVLNTELSLVSGTPSTATQGSVVANDNISVGTSTSIAYPHGQMAQYNNISTLWTNVTPTTYAIFAVEGANSVYVTSNLTPVLGPGATISKRYYDDDNEISFILGLSSGIIVSAVDVNDYGKGTVGGIANSPVDTFVFRTSEYDSDITNLRPSEIPQITNSNINVEIFGGVS